VFRLMLIEYRVRADRRTTVTVTETHKHSPDTTTSTCTSPSTHHAIHAQRAVTGGTVAVRGAATRF
jgi:hypothetical protein